MMVHGADIYRYARELDCEPDEIIDFSSNINLYQPVAELSFSNATITKYADTNYTELKETIAKNYALNKEEITLYNGATAAIYALFHSLKQKSVTLYAPLYGEYQKAALASKKDIYKINRIEDIDQKPQEKSIVVFVNPSTPEGSYYDLASLFKMWKKQKCTVIIDESFLEFEGLASMREEIRNYKKLYIIQSFSKFYSCAGIRIGAIFTNEKNSKKLTPPLWNISSLDAAFLTKRISDTSFQTQSRLLHKEQKEELISILKNANLFDQIVTSEANFILVHSPNAAELFERLLGHKILVRSCESFDYLSHEWLRFAVKDKASHAKLKAALG